jgi:26S proteasome regulatory subunit N2
MSSLISARGVLAFLSEEEPELRVFALQTLNEDIDTVWFEVAESLSQMYDSPFPCRHTGIAFLSSL